MTVSQAVWRSESVLRKVALVLAGSWVVAIAAQVSIPLQPVPLSLQTLAILMVGFTLGSRLGAAALIAYLAQGAMGLPVFANGMNGIAFFGPTAGFLVGFVGMAWLAGLAAERGLAKGMIGTAISALVISALLYIPGVAWPMAVAGAAGIEAGWVGLSASSVWAGFVAPFLMGDAIKAVLAALLVSGAWAAIKARRT
ncbi:biotin transport system substrate-specific component [Rubricella aquisinus]|uniref:Biotin transporter n=1 Tax=Rubricella aquisinus TaxID=2028108 RepID=A0A840X725_9RHOB|nr:biotin transporter BioY [Rubricella aquisinus]MBB5516507.1 biotin transport system substrate-specific component [Rubricella aquisinus]